MSESIPTIDWRELEGHSLEIRLGTDSGLTTVAGFDRQTGKVYVLDVIGELGGKGEFEYICIQCGYNWISHGKAKSCPHCWKTNIQRASEADGYEGEGMNEQFEDVDYSGLYRLIQNADNDEPIDIHGDYDKEQWDKWLETGRQIYDELMQFVGKENSPELQDKIRDRVTKLIADSRE